MDTNKASVQKYWYEKSIDLPASLQVNNSYQKKKKKVLLSKILYK